MQINIQGHHIDHTDSMQDYVHSKFDKLERFSTTLITFKSFYVLNTAPDRRSYAPRKPSRNSRPRGR